MGIYDKSPGLFNLYTQGSCNTFSIGWICLHAVVDMAKLNLFWSITHGAGCICKKNSLLF